MRTRLARAVLFYLLFLITLREGSSKLRKFFTKGSRGSALQFDRGDNVVSFIVPNRHFVSRPYLYFFALSDTELLSFKPSKRKLFRKVYPKVIKPKDTMKNIKMLNRKNKPFYIGPVGQMVARMMIGRPLYFNLFFCNDKHYVYYLTYGAYSEKWFNDHVFRVAKRCPVRAPLTSEMSKTIFKSKSFTLLDSYHRKTTLTVENWKDPRWSHPKKVTFNLTPEVHEIKKEHTEVEEDDESET